MDDLIRTPEFKRRHSATDLAKAYCKHAPELAGLSRKERRKMQATVRQDIKQTRRKLRQHGISMEGIN